MIADEPDRPYRLFFDATHEPQLVPCAVLFIDLLGIRSLASNARAERYLRTLNDALSRSREYLDDDSPWPAAYFSDSLVIVNPVSNGAIGAAVSGLAYEAARLQLDLVQSGYALRGGLAVGDIHLSPGLLFGPGLIAAYDLESKTAIEPRIVLSADAARSVGDGPSDAYFVVDQDGVTVVDYLTTGILEYLLDPAVDGLAAHRDRVRARRKEHERNLTVWSKWNWVGQYRNAVCARVFSNREDLLVDGVGERKFEAIGQ